MISKKELKKYLAQLSTEELINEVEKLFAKFKAVQEYYSVELGGDTSLLLAQYKKKLHKIFAVANDFRNPSMVEANKIIKEFSAVSIYMADTIDLMLYKVELSKTLFAQFGYDGFDSMANSFTSTYDKVVDLIHKHKLEDVFRTRCSIIEGFGSNYYLINKKLGG